MRKYLDLRANRSLGLIFAFLVNTFGPLPSYAQDFALPAPGVRVALSPFFNPSILKGIKVHPDNPFRFDFILDRGDSRLSNDALKDESSRLIKYFLASLTIPEKDLWVNLSPYEKNRIVPVSFGQTEMGRDLLAEDYMLKQITASLIYPEGETGKKFWKRIYEEAAKKFGTTNIPLNTFNKVWIVPEKAVVYENTKAGTAYVVEAKLKVMLEEDYLAFQNNTVILSAAKDLKKPLDSSASPQNDVNALGSQIVREIVIPELTKEVNEGKNFVQLRQVYNSLILATWYKKKIKDSILSQVYANKNKIQGLIIPANPHRSLGAGAGIQVNDIYQRYLQAFKKGSYNYIKEDLDPTTQQMIPRKYFSGGLRLIVPLQETTDGATIGFKNIALYVEKVELDRAMAGGKDATMTPREQAKAIVENALQDDHVTLEKFMRIYNNPQFQDKIIEYIAHLIHVRGIKTVILMLSVEKNVNSLRGRIAEIYHAYILSKAGYEIIALGVKLFSLKLDLDARGGLSGQYKSITEADILVRKDSRFSFVEVKDRSYSLHSAVRPDRLQLARYKNWIDLARSNPQAKNLIYYQLSKQIGAVFAHELMDQLENEQMKVPFILSMTKNLDMPIIVTQTSMTIGRYHLNINQNFLVPSQNPSWIYALRDAALHFIKHEDSEDFDLTVVYLPGMNTEIKNVVVSVIPDQAMAGGKGALRESNSPNRIRMYKELLRNNPNTFYTNKDLAGKFGVVDSTVHKDWIGQNTKEFSNLIIGNGPVEVRRRVIYEKIISIYGKSTIDFIAEKSRFPAWMVGYDLASMKPLEEYESLIIEKPKSQEVSKEDVDNWVKLKLARENSMDAGDLFKEFLYEHRGQNIKVKRILGLVRIFNLRGFNLTKNRVIGILNRVHLGVKINGVEIGASTKKRKAIERREKIDAAMKSGLAPESGDRRKFLTAISAGFAATMVPKIVASQDISQQFSEKEITVGDKTLNIHVVLGVSPGIYAPFLVKRDDLYVLFENMRSFVNGFMKDQNFMKLSEALSKVDGGSRTGVFEFSERTLENGFIQWFMAPYLSKNTIEEEFRINQAIVGYLGILIRTSRPKEVLYELMVLRRDSKDPVMKQAASKILDILLPQLGLKNEDLEFLVKLDNSALRFKAIEFYNTYKAPLPDLNEIEPDIDEVVDGFKNKLDQLLGQDEAMTSPGGIDLTSDKALTVRNNGQGIKFHLDPAQLTQLQDAPGFVPVIISIQPLKNLQEFLGLTQIVK